MNVATASCGSQKPARSVLPRFQMTLVQLAATTGFATDMLFKAQQALFLLPGNIQPHLMSRSVRIPNSWEVVSHLLSIHGGASPSRKTSLEGEQRAQFHLKVTSERGALQISARIIFRRVPSFLKSETPKALIQILVRIVDAGGIQEHLQEIFLGDNGRIKIRNRSGVMEKVKSPQRAGASFETKIQGTDSYIRTNKLRTKVTEPSPGY